MRSIRPGESTKNKRRAKIAKRYDEPIDVSAPDREWGPAGFVWRGRRYEVDRPLGSWREAPHARTNGYRGRSRNGHGTNGHGTKGSRTETSRFVDPPGRIDERQNGLHDREFFRLLARPEGSLATGELDADGFMQHVGSGAVYDVYLDPARGEWRLARVWD